IVGIAGVIVFLLTGQYMAIYQDHLRGMAAMPRLLFRSRHIYILMASLLNLTLGTYLSRVRPGFRHKLECVGSGLIIVSTCLLVAAFIREPHFLQIERTRLSFYGIILLASGTLLHVIGGAA